MKKSILITGSTDGIGKLAAFKLAKEGHNFYLHGRSAEKLTAAQSSVSYEALKGKEKRSEGESYAQSKLALTMWSFYLAVSDEYKGVTGKYFDNDKGSFGPAHPDACKDNEIEKLINVTDIILNY